SRSPKTDAGHTGRLHKRTSRGTPRHKILPPNFRLKWKGGMNKLRGQLQLTPARARDERPSEVARMTQAPSAGSKVGLRFGFLPPGRIREDRGHPRPARSPRL